MYRMSIIRVSIMSLKNYFLEGNRDKSDMKKYIFTYDTPRPTVQMGVIYDTPR